LNAWATAAQTIERVLELPAEADELGRARRFAGRAAERYGLDEDDCYCFTFAANEAVSNAIEHGRSSPDGTIRLRVSVEDGALVFSVEDYGTFAPKAPAVETLPERGRGLAFMAAFVDEVDVRHGEHGTMVRLCKRLSTS
jgi:anti-sigma regulatory factor (Ser/Thr protein kinase)